MPDLNLKSKAVRAELEEIVDFWLDLGVDGFRLDAAKEFVSGATNANVEILTWFNDMVKSKKSDAFIVAEVWTDLGTYAQYYASGVSCFNFAFGNSDGVPRSSGSDRASRSRRGLRSTTRCPPACRCWAPERSCSSPHRGRPRGPAAGCPI